MIEALLAALSVAGASGLNAWLPALLVAVAARLDLVELASPYDVLSSDAGLAVVAAGFALDFVADKVPVLDHALHAVGTVVHPIAAAFVAAGVGGDEVAPAALLAGGAVVGEGIHLARAAARPLSSVLTGGVATPALSLGEDTGALLITLAALALPILGAIAVVALAWGLAVLAHRVRARIRSGSGPDPPPLRA